MKKQAISVRLEMIDDCKHTPNTEGNISKSECNMTSQRSTKLGKNSEKEEDEEKYWTIILVTQTVQE